MIERVLAQVADLGDELLLMTNHPAPYAYLGLPMFGDLFPDHGPLAGIYTAVTHAQHPHTLIVACDMPWLNRDLLRYLIDLRQTADLIVPRWDKYPEPLHAIYNKTCLEPMREKLAAQQLKISGFFGHVRVRFVEREEIVRFDAHGRSFANINTPDELTSSQP